MAEYVIDGISLRVPKGMLNDRIAGKLASGQYEADEANAVRMRVGAGRRVLDLGTGLGFVAALAARASGGENVITVEANPAMLPTARANLDRNGHRDVTLLHGAVAGSDDAGVGIEFEQKKTFWAGRLADSHSDPAAVLSVPVLPFRDLLSAHRPHAVIMDIEGTERFLFGSPWPRYVRTLILELHPHQYPDTVIRAIVDCMSGSGMTYDPGPSRGRLLCFRRLRSA